MQSWSRLIASDLGQAAKKAYQSDPARAYHNWDHVLRLFWHAEHTFALAYDADLDMAILAHDVIYDAAPQKEQRSAQWLRDHAAGNADKAVEHILKTIEHRPSEDNRMVLLDLADLALQDRAGPNLDRIRYESEALYDVNAQQFLTANIKIMTGLHDRISEGMGQPMPDADRNWFERILSGISQSNDLARQQLQSA